MKKKNTQLALTKLDACYNNSPLSMVSYLVGVAFDTVSTRNFPLEFHCGWIEIYREASRQTILGYTFLGLTKLLDYPHLPLQLASRWVSDVERIRLSNLLQREIISEVEAIFHRCGVPYLLLKGQRTGQLYDKPDLRQCGDIDYYFDSSDSLAKALSSLTAEIECNGSIRVLGRLATDVRPIDLLGCKPDGSYILNVGETLIEFHPSLPLGVNSVGEAATHPESLVLASALHILRHASTFGIGMRQLCDLAMECRALTRRKDVEAVLFRFECSLKQYNIRPWWVLLETFLIKYLAIPSSWLPFRGRSYCSPEKLWKIIHRGGNFGFHSQKRSAVTLVKNSSAIAKVAPYRVWSIYRELMENRLSQLK